MLLLSLLIHIQSTTERPVDKVENYSLTMINYNDDKGEGMWEPGTLQGEKGVKEQCIRRKSTVDN